MASPFIPTNLTSWANRPIFYTPFLHVWVTVTGKDRV